jgi:undecaprenol kinase
MNRLRSSFKYAFQGIAHAIRTQANLQIHLAISIIVVVAGIVFRISITEWIDIVLAMMIVLSAELFNTSIENAMDRVSTEVHPLAKVAKDTAAGAVLITAIGSVVIGMLIFAPKLLALIAPR